MESESKAYLTGLILLTTLILGGVSYQIYDTGKELNCRTNKPIGWEITANHSNQWFEAICPYKTKPPIYANCSSFRSTASYLRYGCNEVKVVKLNQPTPEVTLPPHPSSGVGIKVWKCNQTECALV